MRSQNYHTVWVFASCLVASVSFAQETQLNKSGDIVIKERDFRDWRKQTGKYEVGTFYVRENRSRPDSRVISIGFSRFKAKKPDSKQPPIFFLPGGPGDSYLEKEGSTQLRKTPSYVEQLWNDCDVVFVDQRGYSQRGEVLLESFQGGPTKPDSGVALRVADHQRFAKSVTKKYSETKTDLSGYNVLEMVEDVNELRQALGYDKISLRGQSFGCQWSFAIMRKRPEIVARALLSGVEPLDHAFDMPSHLMAATKRMWTDVDNDPKFRKYLPVGGMQTVADAVAAELATRPIAVKKADLDESGNTRTVRILNSEDFPWREPAQILELYHTKRDRWASSPHRTRTYPKLILHLIDSSMGVTPERLKKLRNDPALRYMSSAGFESMVQTADIWPSPDIGDKLRRPVKCDIPVVFVNGDWDTNTPIENMQEIAPFFPNSHSMTVHRAGHGTIEYMPRENPKVLSQLMTFLRTGLMDSLPREITFKPYRSFRPPTFVLPTTPKYDKKSASLDVPLVAQGRNLCGPACIEMVFRFWDVTDFDQHAIAEAIVRRYSHIKRFKDAGVLSDDKVLWDKYPGTGTSTMRSFLRRHADTHNPTRRHLALDPKQQIAEAERMFARVKASVGSGVPVIVHQYTTLTKKSQHYRLVTGYDDDKQIVNLNDTRADGSRIEQTYEDFLNLWNVDEEWLHYNCIIFNPKKRKLDVERE